MGNPGLGTARSGGPLKHDGILFVVVQRIADLEGTVSNLNQYLGFGLAAAVLILALRGLVQRRERQVRDIEDRDGPSQPPAE